MGSESKCEQCDQEMGYATGNPSHKSVPRVCWNSDCYEQGAKTAQGTPDHDKIMQEWRKNCDYLHGQRDWRLRDWNAGRIVDYESGKLGLSARQGFRVAAQQHWFAMRPPLPLRATPGKTTGVTPSGSLVGIERIDGRAPQVLPPQQNGFSIEFEKRLKAVPKHLPREEVTQWLQEHPSQPSSSKTGK